MLSAGWRAIFVPEKHSLFCLLNYELYREANKLANESLSGEFEKSYFLFLIQLSIWLWHDVHVAAASSGIHIWLRFKFKKTEAN